MNLRTVPVHNQHCINIATIFVVIMATAQEVVADEVPGFTE